MNKIVAKINQKIAECHNPDMVNPDISPNANPIYKIYMDGEITYQKGGWAYGRRNVHSFHYPLFSPEKLLAKHGLSFPEKNHENVGYAITTQEHALELRSLLKELYEKSRK